MLLCSLICLSGNLFASTGAKARRAKERLAMYDIPFTVDAFMTYVDRGNHEVVQRFLDAGMDANAINDAGDKALIIAAEKGSLRVMNILLKARADVNSADKDGTTALMYASYYRQTEAVKLLVKNKVNVNIQNQSGMTALMFAIMGGCIGCIDAVLTKESDITLQNKQGKTATALARNLGYLAVANYIKSKLDYLNNRQTPERKEYEINLKKFRES